MGGKHYQILNHMGQCSRDKWKMVWWWYNNMVRWTLWWVYQQFLPIKVGTFKKKKTYFHGMSLTLGFILGSWSYIFSEFYRIKGLKGSNPSKHTLTRHLATLYPGGEWVPGRMRQSLYSSLRNVMIVKWRPTEMLPSEWRMYAFILCGHAWNR